MPLSVFFRKTTTRAGSMDGRLRRIYERIHFDPKPIDIAILGFSSALLSLSAAAIEGQLAQRGEHANVVLLTDAQWERNASLLPRKDGDPRWSPVR